MKAEYNFSTMKRKGHPLREKVSRGDIVLVCPLDLPDTEFKLASFPSEERVLVAGFLESYQNIKSPS